MYWLLIIVLVIIVIIVIKFKEYRHKIGFLVIALIIAFFGFTAFNVYTHNNLDLSNVGGIFHAGKVYFSWLGQSFSNVKTLSGYAVQQDWGAVNSSFSNLTGGH